MKLVGYMVVQENQKAPEDFVRPSFLGGSFDIYENQETAEFLVQEIVEHFHRRARVERVEWTVPTYFEDEKFREWVKV